MSKVSITRSLLDDLAMSISTKSGEPVPMTLTEMKDAVDSIQTGGGGSVTQDQDGYIVLPPTGGGSPSATQHTIYFEFTDSTDATINAWYDSSFISDAITATEPITYGQKTVDSASLDGVAWYTRPTEQWETVLNGTLHVNTGNPYGGVWASELGSVSIALGSVWRVTIDNGTPYTVTATANGVFGSPKPSSPPLRKSRLPSSSF